MLVAFSLIFIVIYAVLYFNADKIPKQKISVRAAQILMVLHGITIIFSVILIWLEANGWRLRGVWSNSTILLFALLSGILFHFLAGVKNLSLSGKIYFKAFGALPLVAGSALLIPFIGIVLVLSLLFHIFPSNDILYTDNDYTVRSAFGGVLGTPDLEISEKTFLLEHTLHYETDPPNEHLGPWEIDSLKRISGSSVERFLVYPDTGSTSRYLIVRTDN